MCGFERGDRWGGSGGKTGELHGALDFGHAGLGVDGAGVHRGEKLGVGLLAGTHEL